eukprot:COSAG05_NODE_8626_length_686_cov_1.725724_1_plen_126_part_10
MIIDDRHLADLSKKGNPSSQRELADRVCGHLSSHHAGGLSIFIAQGAGANKKGRARDLSSKMCEGCGLEHASYGLPSDGKKRWCAGCGREQAGAQDLSSKMCEGCGRKHASYGLPSDGKKRWCAGC